MLSIALIGGDGAGKTTIARMLEKKYPEPVKYLYMGINVESSNIALPSSRLVTFLKRSKDRSGRQDRGRDTSLHNQTAQKSKSRGILWSTARLMNRLAEEWYRQLISLWYRSKGYIVVYDRHFLYDFSFSDLAPNSKLPPAERIHRWCLNRFYPGPDLTVFLDAPAEVLFARKGEATIAYLDSRRREFHQRGKITPNFVRVDATCPPREVYEEVSAHITKLRSKHERPETAAVDH
jgi:thymidylate kinase